VIKGPSATAHAIYIDIWTWSQSVVCATCIVLQQQIKTRGTSFYSPRLKGAYCKRASLPYFNGILVKVFMFLERYLSSAGNGLKTFTARSEYVYELQCRCKDVAHKVELQSEQVCHTTELCLYKRRQVQHSSKCAQQVCMRLKGMPGYWGQACMRTQII